MMDKQELYQWRGGDDRVIVAEMLTSSESAHWKVCDAQVRQFVLAKTKNLKMDDREDIVQDVMLRIHKYLSDFRFQCRLRTWLYNIMYTCIIDAYRKENHITKYEVYSDIFHAKTSLNDLGKIDDDDDDDIYEDLTEGSAQSAEDTYLARDELLQAYDSLLEYVNTHAKSERNRLIIQKSFFEAYSLKEVAEQVSCSPAVAGYIVRSARRYIREKMVKATGASSKGVIPVAILGGGIAGLTTSAELQRRNISCVIIDTLPFAAYTSQANQGLLQSRMFYVTGATPDEEAAEYCRKGFHWAQSHYKSVIQHSIPCYSLYRTRAERDEDIRSCQNFGIDASAISRRELEAREPLLPGSGLYGASVPDRCFNNAAFVQFVAREAHARGARFYPVSSIEGISFAWDGLNWHLFFDDGKVIECKMVILACGSLIPTMLEKLLPGRGGGYQLTKTVDVSLRAERPLTHSMLLTPNEPEGLSCVPFDLPQGGGITLNIQGSDELARDHHDYDLPPDWSRRLADSLQQLFPNIKKLASEMTILAHPYVYQKIHRSENIEKNRFSRKPIRLFYAPGENAPENVIVIAPGKFTAVPIVAQELADKIANQLRGTLMETRMPATKLPAFAVQKYYEEPEYQFVVQEDGDMAFKPYNRETVPEREQTAIEISP